MNLIITCARHLEDETKEELKEFLKNLEILKSEISITSMSGILTAQTSLIQLKVVKKN